VLASIGDALAQAIATEIGVRRSTVWRWQQRFAERGGGAAARKDS